ncbi:MAG: tRNA pseudouridine(55) synthase TruB [Synergistaceae bacterium]|jgi:tRNA pseudouridine(55) synthase|nr:tRNA pseudouridine(55) synthase TruB [Synergistaceae bacterium]
MPQGILPLDKPLGVRSTHCVERVRRVIGRNIKVGHGGTLDSSASGLLVLLIGGATRLSGLIMDMPKVYRAVIRLGAETSTCDFTGDQTSVSEWRGLNGSDVDGALTAFMGWRMQVPPKVSAVHVGGRRAHEILRGGGDPDIKPRPVFIESISRTTDISEEGDFELLVRCGKGTYIRALARDIGRALGCGAHIASLIRESVGPFSLSRAFNPGPDISPERSAVTGSVLPLEEIAKFLPSYSVTREDASRLARGQNIRFSYATRRTLGDHPPAHKVLLLSQELFSVARLDNLDGGMQVAPDINIPL